MSTVTEKAARLEETLQAFITSVGIEFNRVYNSQLRTEDEMRRETREMNRKWGDLANKLGTMVEDPMALSLPRIVQETLGMEVRPTLWCDSSTSCQMAACSSTMPLPRRVSW